MSCYPIRQNLTKSRELPKTSEKRREHKGKKGMLYREKIRVLGELKDICVPKQVVWRYE